MKHYIYAYLAPNGRWSGRVIEGEEAAAVAGCDSEDEAIEALREQFPDAHVLNQASA